MLERFSESNTIETKEAAVKRLAGEMLEKFRVRFKRDGKRKLSKEPLFSPGSIATEEGKIIVAKEEKEVAAELRQPKEPETRESLVSETKKEQKKKTDKGAFESITTNDYFESWDEDVMLEGNPGIKEQIRKNIIEAERTNQQRYKDAAADLGISVEEFKVRLQAKVEDMVKRANFFRATQLDVLEKIMNDDGRWKSQFETGTSEGTLNPRFRATAEMKMFGFNKDEVLRAPSDKYGDELGKTVLIKDKERRPIYGYFSDEEHGAINSYGRIPPPTNVHYYGAINIKIKKERALKKATLTFHDSLDSADNWPPTPAAKPHFTSFRFRYSEGRILNDLKNASIVNWGESYTEVQYHGQLTMDDVESIHISTHNGLDPKDIEEVHRIFKEYKKQHPESPIQLVEF